MMTTRKAGRRGKGRNIQPLSLCLSAPFALSGLLLAVLYGTDDDSAALAAFTFRCTLVTARLGAVSGAASDLSSCFSRSPSLFLLASLYRVQLGAHFSLPFS